MHYARVYAKKQLSRKDAKHISFLQIGGKAHNIIHMCVFPAVFFIGEPILNILFNNYKNQAPKSNRIKAKKTKKETQNMWSVLPE